MKVGVDGRSLRAGRAPRGVAAYLDCLLAELASSPGNDYEVVSRRSRLTYASAAVLGRPRLDRLAGGCDVVWAPAPAPLAVSREVPLVLTVHDLSFEHRPGDYTPYERSWHRLARPRRLAKRAARVITVSGAVRDQVLSEWGLPEGKVVTVLSGPGRPPAEPTRPPQGLPERYFLAVGALEPRKGLDLVLEAHALARRQGLVSELVIAGRGRLAERAAAGGAHLLGFQEPASLDAVYSRALALVSASREEGFGFTPLEALARGTAAVVPDLAPFRETLAGAALRFPPGDADALAAAMLRLEREPKLRDELLAGATEPLERLSWAEAARRTRAVLEEAAA